MELFVKAVTMKRKEKTIGATPLEMKLLLLTNNQKSEISIITITIELSS